MLLAALLLARPAKAGIPRAAPFAVDHQGAVAAAEARARAWHFRLSNTSRLSKTLELPPSRLWFDEVSFYECTTMANEVLRLVFVHVYKAGGSSVKSLLEGNCEQVQAYGWLNRRSASALFTAREPRSNTSWRRDPRTFTFAVVRDPVERFLSAVRELSGPGRNRSIPLTGRLMGDATLREVLDSIHEHSFWDDHIKPQWSQLTNSLGEPIPVDAIYPLDEFFTGVVPDLQAAFGSPALVPHIVSPVSKNLAALPKLDITAAQLVEICKLYWFDYALLRLPPRHCDDPLTALDALSSQNSPTPHTAATPPSTSSGASAPRSGAPSPGRRRPRRRPCRRRARAPPPAA